MMSSRQTGSIVKDGRILYRLSRKVKGFQYHPKFKYLIHNVRDGEIREQVAPLGYDVQYFDGCFFPFLVTK